MLILLGVEVWIRHDYLDSMLIDCDKYLFEICQWLDKQFYGVTIYTNRLAINKIIIDREVEHKIDFVHEVRKGYFDN